MNGSFIKYYIYILLPSSSYVENLALRYHIDDTYAGLVMKAFICYRAPQKD